MGPNDKAKAMLDEIREKRTAKGLSWEDFGVQAQAQYAGGNPELWAKHAIKWRELGASHLAIATHNAGQTDVQGHLKRIQEYLDSVQ
jgi:hypothetical protein